MMAVQRLSWLHGVALLCMTVMSATPCLAQRDDADTLPADRPQGNEPPRLMRGGIMQQLRSVTESVIGAPEDRPAEKRPSSRDPKSNVPTPPPLGVQRRRGPQVTEAESPDDVTPRNSNARQSQSLNNNSPHSRAWAGQFLIPNYRLRDQVGTRPNMPTNTKRSAPVAPSDSVEMSLADVPEVPQTNTGVETPRSSSPANQRMYLGQRSPVQMEMSDAPADEPMAPVQKKPAAVARASQPIPSLTTTADAVKLKLSDETKTSDQKPADEPTEVLVSHVPDIPFVPRKPVPKRDRSKLLDNTLKSQDNSQVLPATPSPALPSSNASRTSTAAPARPAQGDTTTPSAPLTLPPTIPSLELSAKTETAKTETFVQPESPALAPSTLPQAPATASAPTLPPVPKRPIAASPAGKPKVTTPAAPSAPKPAELRADNKVVSIPAPSTSTLPPALPEPAKTKLPAQTISSPVDAPLPSGPAPSTSLPSPSALLPPKSLEPISANQTSLPPTPALPTAATTVPFATQTPAVAPPAQHSPSRPAQSPATEQVAGDNQRMQMEVPHVQVKLLGPGDLTAGTSTSYELQVQNNDRIPLSGLILRMETPQGVEITPTIIGANSAETEKEADGSTLLTWHVSQVAAGAQARLPLQLKAQAARNFAVAIEWTVLPQSGIEEIVVKQADLQVALEGPVEVERNAANAYRVRVSNPGTAPARQVKLQVSAGAQPTSQITVGDLAPGQTEQIDMDLTFEKAGQVAIAVQAAAEGELNRAANINIQVRQAILVAAIALPASVPHGSPLTANVELSNTGDAPARGIQAGLALPEGTQVGQLPTGVTRQGDKLLWDIEQVPPGQVVAVPIEMVLPTPGHHELSFASVQSDGTVTTSSGAINVEAFADLKLSVNDPASPAPVGTPVTYELTITNRGSREARDLAIVAQFSDGIEPESAAGLGHRVVPGQVLFETLPHIAAGQSITLKVVARATTAGVHRFRAEVRCEETEARLVEEESTRFLETPGRIATQPGTTLNR